MSVEPRPWTHSRRGNASASFIKDCTKPRNCRIGHLSSWLGNLLDVPQEWSTYSGIFVPRRRLRSVGLKALEKNGNGVRLASTSSTVDASAINGRGTPVIGCAVTVERRRRSASGKTLAGLLNNSLWHSRHSCEWRM